MTDETENPKMTKKEYKEQLGLFTQLFDEMQEKFKIVFADSPTFFFIAGLTGLRGLASLGSFKKT